MSLGPVSILLGDNRQTLKGVAPDSADVIITSPPFWKLRSYLKADDPAKVYELGSEPTPDCGLRDYMALRDDLTDEERAFVLAELTRRCLI